MGGWVGGVGWGGGGVGGWRVGWGVGKGLGLCGAWGRLLAWVSLPPKMPSELDKKKISRGPRLSSLQNHFCGFARSS